MLRSFWIDPIGWRGTGYDQKRGDVRTAHGWLPDATELKRSGNGWNGSVETLDPVPSSSRRLRSQCVIDVDGSRLDEGTYGKPAGSSAKPRCNVSSEVQRGQMLCNLA